MGFIFVFILTCIAAADIATGIQMIAFSDIHVIMTRMGILLFANAVAAFMLAVMIGKRLYYK